MAGTRHGSRRTPRRGATARGVPSEWRSVAETTWIAPSWTSSLEGLLGPDVASGAGDQQGLDLVAGRVAVQVDLERRAGPAERHAMRLAGDARPPPLAGLHRQVKRVRGLRGHRVRAEQAGDDQQAGESRRRDGTARGYKGHRFVRIPHRTPAPVQDRRCGHGPAEPRRLDRLPIAFYVVPGTVESDFHLVASTTTTHGSGEALGAM